MSIIVSLLLFGILLHSLLKLKSELKDTKQEQLLLTLKVSALEEAYGLNDNSTHTGDSASSLSVR